jgi:hypothetical protein
MIWCGKTSDDSRPEGSCCVHRSSRIENRKPINRSHKCVHAGKGWNHVQMAGEEGKSNTNLVIPSDVNQLLKSTNAELTGAKGVAICFSTASMRTASTRAVVVNISMNTPWELLIPLCKTVLVAICQPQNSRTPYGDLLDR